MGNDVIELNVTAATHSSSLSMYFCRIFDQKLCPRDLNTILCDRANKEVQPRLVRFANWQSKCLKGDPCDRGGISEKHTR
jgi:hypothetical protein